MNHILIGLVPLIAFAILDSYTNLNIALIATILITIAEIIYTLYAFGTLDSISIFSIGLVFLLVTLSYQKKNKVIFKLKPAILNGCMGLYIIGNDLINQPLLIKISQKYPEFVPPQTQLILSTPEGQQLMTNLSFNLGIALLLHGLFVGYSGIKHNNFWWAFNNIVSLFLLMVMACLFAIL